jgi:hypothetical protein
MDIVRGDTFDHLVSMSSLKKGLNDSAKLAGIDKFSNVKCGDINTTMDKTKLVKTIMLKILPVNSIALEGAQEGDV